MKKTFGLICLTLLLQTAAVKYDRFIEETKGMFSQQAKTNSTSLSQDGGWQMYQNKEAAISIARQVPAPEAPVENRQGFSWWWWIIGVIIVIGLGMLMYTLIKKDPKKDVT